MGLIPGRVIPIVVGRGIEAGDRATEGDIDFEADAATPGGGGELAGGYCAAPLLCCDDAKAAEGCVGAGAGAGEAEGTF